MSDQLVPVEIDGQIGTVPASQLKQAREAGGEVVSEDVLQKAKDEAEFGGVGGEAAAAGEGFARTLTLGGSDVLATGLGGEATRRAMEGRKRTNPYAAGGGEVAGAIAPLLFSGGAAAPEEAGVLGLGRLARGAPGIVSDIGKAGEGVASSFLGRGAESMAGRVAQKAIPGAIGGGIEGAAYGVGNQISEDALGNHEANAEKLVAAARHGFFLGGALGGAVSGLAGLRGGAEAASEGAAAADLTAASPYRTAGERAEAIAPAAEGKAATLADFAENQAGKKAFKALGGNAGEARAMLMKSRQGIGPSAEKVGLDVMRDMEAQTGKSFGLHDIESTYAHVVQRDEELGEKLGTMLKKLDENGSGVAPDVASYVAKARKELVEPNTIGTREVMTKGGEVTHVPVLLPGSEGTVAAVEKHLGTLEKAFADRAPTFEQWQKSRRLLDSEINFNARNATPETGALKQLRGLMEGELERAGEEAAQGAGQSFANEYTTTKELFQSYRAAREMVEGKMARQEYSNRAFSLGDMLGAVKGAVLGGAPGALLGGAAAHVTRTRGDFIAADLLHRASKLEMLGGTASRVDASLTGGVKALLGPAAKGEGAPLMPLAKAGLRAGSSVIVGKNAAENHAAYAAHTKALTAFATNPAHATQSMGERLGDMPHYAPKTAAAVTDTVMRGTNFLLSKMPAPRIDARSLTPQLQDPTRISPMEISRFARYARAVDDPLSVLSDAKDGKLTHEQVEAVKAVYPNLYQQMQDEVQAYVATAEHPIPYEQEVRLGTLLGIPTNGTMDRGFIQAVQATYPASEAEAETKPGANPGAPVGHMDIAGAYASAGDQIEKGRQ